ncbi:hypothetical protein FPL06_18605 [Xanthomonas citri pv. glycines]|nr:hypothetical protein BHE84_18635 [Xanthomonas citri pv. glycines str. 8ra]QDR44364.1 hypothetical protein FPK90_06390 [Xanthomonas citri pv. glycines]QTK35772.1 hypothetical protein XcgCFBP2526_06045 [Xanthomonas citri pv. glycines CFBP 2526]QDS06554.1 hypothetical protein FPL00_06435 [Xanthomonas citri pv. glycines]QDS10834.1 hypothetical protein FPL03_06380 [Xanthomonas citri pv. glycines]
MEAHAGSVSRASLRRMASAGTPLWATFVISFGAATITHLLTLWRETRKRDADAISAWKKECDALITQITDEANAYYFDPKLVDSTVPASQRLVVKLRRLGKKVREVHCVEPRDTKQCGDLLQELRDLITLPEDFQLPKRTIREHTDPLMAQIMDCEERLRANLDLRRKTRK